MRLARLIIFFDSNRLITRDDIYNLETEICAKMLDLGEPRLYTVSNSRRYGGKIFESLTPRPRDEIKSILKQITIAAKGPTQNQVSWEIIENVKAAIL